MLLQSTKNQRTKTSELPEDILRTLLYFDIFGHPLRLHEIHNFLPSNADSLDELRSAFVQEPLRSQVVGKWEMYSLKNDSFDQFHDRLEKERRAIRMWKIARLVTMILRLFPFVRGVFVSGELSKGVASRKSDIDFFVVTAERRVWITRTLFTIFKKIVLFNRKRFFCYNHIVSENHLEISDRNIYSATEIVTLRPIHNTELYAAFLHANRWVKGYMPNFQVPPPPALNSDERRPLSEKILDAFLSSEFLDSVDQRLLTIWTHIWDRRYATMQTAKRSELFQCRSHVSTAYVRDFLQSVILEYNLRLRQHGLSSRTIS